MYPINEFPSIHVCRENRTTKGKIMASRNDRLAENVPGPFYVDSSCIDCDLCRGNAPQFFGRNDGIGYSVVYKQPETPEEIHEAQEALDGCPTASIGNDGILSPSPLLSE
jgi:ferredoxin